MKLIEVTDIYDNKVTVNMDNVEFVSDSDEGCFIAFVSNGTAFTTKETYDEIKNKLTM